MPITFTVAEHPAKPFAISYLTPEADSSEILPLLEPAYTPKKILQSSIDGSQKLITPGNGFVQGVLMAYNQHHNLVIRQSINAHAEELRDKFVAHEGKKHLRVVSKSTTMDGMDFGELSIQMSDEIHKNVSSLLWPIKLPQEVMKYLIHDINVELRIQVKDTSLVPWVLPNFTTTTPDDSVICSVLLMSTLKEYFSYEMAVCCGIPAITLEGTQEDWRSILTRIDKLHEFGEEPTQWAAILRVILLRFVRAFDAGGPHADKEFWERMVHEEHGSGTYWLGGWMSAFCAWDSKGVFNFANRDSKEDSNDDWKNFEDDSLSFGSQPEWVSRLEIDGHPIPRVPECPEGHAEVDVKVVDEFGETWDCSMLAGHTSLTLKWDQLDTIHIAPQWFMYVKGVTREQEEEEKLAKILDSLGERSLA
ncbi:hypothetical protein H0H87_002003 [Tephrocybe sp. NHM501043]|nr:hypothetical protein H0H87_002003 [Tephrocybe sp. NHM501043]